MAAGDATVLLTDQDTLDAGIEALRGLDPGFVASLLATGGRPAPRRRAPGFEGLAWIIVSQKISTASAEAVFLRLKARLLVIEARTVTALGDEELRLCGLSASKVRTLHAVADAERGGILDFARLTEQSAEAAHETLVSLKGIGPWTADVFLLFCMGHPDSWPAGDLALQEAARLALGLADRPNEKALRDLGARWRPWRGVAAYLLWNAYRVLKSRAA